MPSNDNVLAALRLATHAAHVRINRHPFLSGLIKPGFSLQKYRNLLQAYFHIYGWVERRIATFSEHNALGFSYDARTKLPWLVADLGHLGVDHQALGTASFPTASAPTASGFDDAGALVGTLYVIEGATLGGQVISRHLQSTLGLGVCTGARFFNGYGDAALTQQRWQDFGEFAGTIGHRPDLVQSAQLAAVTLFDLIETQLDDLHVRCDH